MSKRRIAILGNGGAAIHAARAARTSGYEGEIHLLSDTDTSAFNPMLSPYYLKRAIPWENCFPFGESFYARYDVTCHFNAPVERLDATNHRITFAKGRQLSYDQCLIATGASPVIPPVPGLKNSPRCFTLRTAVSAKNLEKAIPSAKKVVVLGASLVGLKVAEILAKRGVRVILLDVIDHILPRGADPSCAAVMKSYFEEHGVDIRLGCTLEGMEGAQEGVACHFPESIVEEADFVVVCAGVRPNIDFINNDEVAIGQAILVNERMGTNVSNLYAAGDVSEGLNLLTGKHEWMGTWGNACYQGRVAGENMAGKDTISAGSVQQNISPFFNWTYAQMGDVRAQGERVHHIVFGDPDQGGYFVLVFDDDILTGVNLINSAQLAGKLRRALTQKLPWGDWPESTGGALAAWSLEKALNDMNRDMPGPLS
jgi:NADPH-dependent 2,4-dienoyl-CoA reductase/sulfur reductase-like enzyme